MPSGGVAGDPAGEEVDGSGGAGAVRVGWRPELADRTENGNHSHMSGGAPDAMPPSRRPPVSGRGGGAGAPSSTPVRWVTIVVALVLAGACSSPTRDDGRLRIEAGFHPLAFVAERVGGDRVVVRDLTGGGVDAHHLELRARDIGAMIDADLVLYLRGLQPAIDAAAGEFEGHGFDVTDIVDLVAADRHGDDAPEHLDSHDDGHGHGLGDGGDGHGHDHGDGAPDLHFWTDPERMIDLAEAVRDRLVDLDPAGAADFDANTEALVSDLEALVDRFDRGLTDCESRDILVTHASFGYLAERFDLNQIPITGLIPVEDPSAARIRDAVRTIRDRDIRTVFSEPLISPRIAEAVASEANIDIAVLDPIEGLVDEAADYPTIMDANLDALRRGLRCR